MTDHAICLRVEPCSKDKVVWGGDAWERWLYVQWRDTLLDNCVEPGCSGLCVSEGWRCKDLRRLNSGELSTGELDTEQ